jgi:hypothetical protein
MERDAERQAEVIKQQAALLEQQAETIEKQHEHIEKPTFRGSGVQFLELILRSAIDVRIRSSQW